MGVAIRTKKPLDLHLAPLVWKQLCCIPLLLEDLEEVDLLYVQTLNSILHIEDSGITEDNFHEVGCGRDKNKYFAIFEHSLILEELQSLSRRLWAVI